jgi:dipeptidyl aminopeptidase/acylaminoacyl peptidase
LAALPVALAYRFALVYRVRAGYPVQHPPRYSPTDVGLPFEMTSVRTPDGLHLPAWFIPAAGRASATGPEPGPGVVLVHGWESARDRTLPNAQVLHAAGFHVLTFDVRGHGANGPEELPMTAGEYGSDALAAIRTMLDRPEVTTVGVLGHSLGGVGALIAAAQEPRLAAAVIMSAPADPYRLTRQTFRLARLPIPDPIAWPLAWLTTHVYVRPRGHTVRDLNATRAAATYRGPLLLIHGGDDVVVPVAHLGRLAAAARTARGPDDAAVETLLLPRGQHSWLYEFPEVRRAIAAFFARTLGGRFTADDAARRADAVPAARLPDPATPISAAEAEPGGLRSLASIARMRMRERGPRAPGDIAAPDERGGDLAAAR